MNTLRCSICKEYKIISDFYRDSSRSRGYDHRCKVCKNTYKRVMWAKGGEWVENQRKRHNDRNRRQIKRRRERFSKYKEELICEKCGFSHSIALDFHHKDPSEKELEISKAHIMWTWERVLKEIEKCEVLCANCHRIEHNGG